MNFIAAYSRDVCFQATRHVLFVKFTLKSYLLQKGVNWEVRQTFKFV